MNIDDTVKEVREAGSAMGRLYAADAIVAILDSGAGNHLKCASKIVALLEKEKRQLLKEFDTKVNKALKAAISPGKRIGVRVLETGYDGNGKVEYRR
jgi:hypothetical protein